jgi:hypothetical protein
MHLKAWATAPDVIEVALHSPESIDGSVRDELLTRLLAALRQRDPAPHPDGGTELPATAWQLDVGAATSPQGDRWGPGWCFGRGVHPEADRPALTAAAIAYVQRLLVPGREA